MNSSFTDSEKALMTPRKWFLKAVVPLCYSIKTSDDKMPKHLVEN